MAYKNKGDNKDDAYSPGQLIAVTNEKNKHSVRDVYVVNKAFDEKLQVNKIIRFHSKNPKIQTNPRIVHRNNVYKIDKGSKPSTSVVNETMQKQHHTEAQKSPSKWQPFRDYSDILEDDDDIQSSQTAQKHDPYQELRQWEIRQREHAQQSLQYHICSPIRNTVPQPSEAIDQNTPMERRHSVAFSDEWDHRFDTEHQEYEEEDNVDYDDIFENTVLTPMHRVQNIDTLYEQHNLNIDTNRCQNVEAILPKPKAKRGKKKISPPRKELPLEKERRKVITRSATKGSGKVSTARRSVRCSTASNTGEEEKEGTRNYP